ncbi:TIGR03620 family F420-dependent LLM class oxidoreductase [Nocardia sp. NPDC049190]|uniref:TIGR03620 family F420-dependent LLM class oxidoreductase n=1 Tax=Nocardia sp. NPDC049190 TaxID=3155650 RepID=UPI0034033460
MATPDLGSVGAYLVAQAFGRHFPGVRAAELERLGYGTLWLAGSPPADLAVAEAALDVTESVTVGTAIVNVWSAPVDEVAASYHRIEERHPGRFVLGVGIGHPEATKEYRKPYDALAAYVERLLELGVPQDRLILAALRKRMLRLSHDRAAGALPYFTTPRHTAYARETLGADRLLAVVASVVLDEDLDAARATAREWSRTYLNLENYVANLRETGFPDLKTGDEPDDALLDVLSALGSAERIAERVRTSLADGADHVPVFPLPATADPLPAFTAIAHALGLPTAK